MLFATRTAMYVPRPPEESVRQNTPIPGAVI